MIFMFMELFKLLKQGDLFHFFLFKTSLPQFFHQAQDEAVRSLSGLLRFSEKVAFLSTPQTKSAFLITTGISPIQHIIGSKTQWSATDSRQLFLPSELGKSLHVLSLLWAVLALQVSCYPTPAQSFQLRFSYFVSTPYVPKMSPSLQSLPQHEQMAGRRGQPRLPGLIRNSTLSSPGVVSRASLQGRSSQGRKMSGRKGGKRHPLSTYCVQASDSLLIYSTPIPVCFITLDS